MMSASSSETPVRVLVVDDSVFNRRSISDILTTGPSIPASVPKQSGPLGHVD